MSHRRSHPFLGRPLLGAALALTLTLTTVAADGPLTRPSPHSPRGTAPTPARPGSPTLAAYPPPTGDRLVTNEHATYSGGRTASRNWVANSGSLFTRDGAYWTGVPDSCVPDEASTECTDSNVFRLNSRRTFPGGIAVSLAVRQNGELSDPGCEPEDTCWHGVHIWLRYHSEYDLYYVSLQRADGNVVIKRKVPCGDANDGTYVDLSELRRHPARPGQWQRYTVTVSDAPDGSVVLGLYDDDTDAGRPVVTGVDRGGRNPNWTKDCQTPGRYSSDVYPPLRAGSIGVRGDYSDFSFSEVTVRRL